MTNDNHISCPHRAEQHMGSACEDCTEKFETKFRRQYKRERIVVAAALRLRLVAMFGGGPHNYGPEGTDRISLGHEEIAALLDKAEGR